MKVLYRMSGCEVAQSADGICLLHEIRKAPRTLQVVAWFPTRRAAINYLAKEFVIPIQH